MAKNKYTCKVCGVQIEPVKAWLLGYYCVNHLQKSK